MVLLIKLTGVKTITFFCFAKSGPQITVVGTISWKALYFIWIQYRPSKDRIQSLARKLSVDSPELLASCQIERGQSKKVKGHLYPSTRTTYIMFLASPSAGIAHILSLCLGAFEFRLASSITHPVIVDRSRAHLFAGRPYVRVTTQSCEFKRAGSAPFLYIQHVYKQQQVYYYTSACRK